MSEPGLAQPNIYVSPAAYDAPAITLKGTSAEELSALWPVDPAAVRNMVPADQSRLQGSPQDLFAELSTITGCMLWGVHVGDRRGDMVGIATLCPVTNRQQCVGLAILDARHHKQGIGPRVVLGLAACAFDLFGCRQLAADPLESNYAVQRVLEGVGFVRCDQGAAAQGVEPYNWRTQWLLTRPGLHWVPRPRGEAAARSQATFSILKAAASITYSYSSCTQ